MSEVYSLAPGEEVIFELNVQNPIRGNDTDPAAIAQKIIQKLFPFKCCNKSVAVIVVTNMRILVTSLPTCCGGKNKFLWTFPRTALNGVNGFELIAGKYSCCDTYTLSIGLSYGLAEDDELSFETPDVRTIEQAQAVLAKFHELAQYK